MSHFGDFMDGVPVKISEKYKRPPRIELPYSVTECPSRAQHVVDNVQYCFKFETNVVSKLTELRNAKETKKNEQRHRLQLLQEEKQRKLDAIAAAEAEEKLKQLSVSDVSYPSTEEISEMSPDDKAENTCDITSTKQLEESLPAVALNAEYNFPTQCTQTESQMNILQPIQVQSNFQQNNLLDDPDPLHEYKMQKAVKIPQYNPAFSKHVDTLTYKDFENDTSSPFDNVELKTINDMEQLAQVLQSQRESTTSCYPQQQYVPEPVYNVIPNCASQAQIPGMMYSTNNVMDQPIQGPSLIYASPLQYPCTNGYFNPENTCDTMPVDHIYNVPNYQYYAPSNQYSTDPVYYGSQVMRNESGELHQQSNRSNYIPTPYYYNYQPLRIQPTNYNTALSKQRVDLNSTSEEPSSGSQSTQSRSRSVPDIVRELDQEIASAKLRANESSYNASPAPKIVPQSSSSEKKIERKSRRRIEQLPNPFDKLSPKLQSMCQKIHGMGFPLDRVARICTLVGDNDKKIIEGLLILGELMDVGFSEGKVSAALAKHEFNKDKALDELVS